MLFTSGTTSRPKAVELTHNNLTSYVTGTVEFGSASTRRRGVDLRAALSHRRRRRGAVESVRGPKDGVPHQVRPRRVGAPGGRRRRHHRDRRADDARPHRRCARSAPDRAADAAESGVRRIEGRAAAGAQGARHCCPSVGFVNAYGLTETSSTIAVLTPDDHREALGRVGRGGRPPARFGRSAGPRHRGADPRRRRHRARPGRDRRAVRPRRPGVGPVRRDRLGARRRGLVPHQRRCHA